jgi:hypothetical protein
MAAWIPLLKASLPYLSKVIASTVPAFTAKPPDARPDEVVPRQIAELQTAVTHNAESVKALALQLKETIERIESGSGGLQDELKRAKRMALVSLVVAALAIAVAIGAFLTS